MPDLKPFSLGSIQFSEMEVPSELADLGSAQSMAVHEFAGGIKAIQLFGAFPQPQTWHGFLIGAQAEQRANQMKQLSDNGDPVTLQYSGWSFYGVVKNFKITAQSAWEISYECTFEPVEDDSNNSTAPPTATAQALLGTAQSIANNQATSPASLFPMTPAVTQGVSNLNAGINSALQNNFNNLANIPGAKINSLKAQVSSIRSTLAPMIASTDPATASAAKDLDQTLLVINRLLDNPAATEKEINVTNPNLFSLAATYYNDVSKWELIANRNGLLDPMPIGTFHLVIPVDSSSFSPQIPVLI